MNLIQKNKISYFRTRYMTAVSVYEFYFARASGWNEVFVLDEVKDEPEVQGQDGKSKKRKRKSAGFQPTAKNFGSRISINKVKSASKIVIGWRCRLGSSTKFRVPSHAFEPPSK